MTKFWLVWRHNGQSPTVMHNSERLAMEEAYRLAGKNVGIKFYVLEATMCVEGTAVLTTHKLVEAHNG